MHRRAARTPVGKQRSVPVSPPWPSCPPLLVTGGRPGHCGRHGDAAAPGEQRPPPHCGCRTPASRARPAWLVCAAPAPHPQPGSSNPCPASCSRPLWGMEWRQTWPSLHAPSQVCLRPLPACCKWAELSCCCCLLCMLPVGARCSAPGCLPSRWECSANVLPAVLVLPACHEMRCCNHSGEHSLSGLGGQAPKLRPSAWSAKPLRARRRWRRGLRSLRLASPPRARWRWWGPNACCCTSGGWRAGVGRAGLGMQACNGLRLVVGERMC